MVFGTKLVWLLTGLVVCGVSKTAEITWTVLTWEEIYIMETQRRN